MSEAKEKSKRNEKRIKWNETDEKRNNTNIEKRMNAAKLGVERSKANKILNERTNEWTYERKQQQSKAEEKKKHSTAEYSAERIPNNDRAFTEYTPSLSSDGNGNTLGMCIWPDMRRERRAQTQNSYKIVCSLCSHIFRFSCARFMDVPAADIFQRPTHFVWTVLGTWVSNACYAKIDIVHTVDIVQMMVFQCSRAHTYFLFQYKFCGAVVCC